MARKETVERVKTDLAIDEDIPLQEKGWFIRRAGWFFILLVVALAAAGFFGNGPVSKQTHTDGQTKVEYERYFRHEARMELKVALRQTGGTQAMISFPNSYLQNFRLESIVPEPKESFVQGNSTHYLFPGTDSMTIVFYLAPQSFGTISGWININNRQFSISHYIYP